MEHIKPVNPTRKCTHDANVVIHLLPSSLVPHARIQTRTHTPTNTYNPHPDFPSALRANLAEGGAEPNRCSVIITLIRLFPTST